MEELNIITFSTIVVACYILGAILKHWIPTDKVNKWIPTIVTATGVGLGILSFFIIPDYPADNLLTAIVIGAGSGFTSVGINQLGKQLTNDTEG